MKFVKTFPIIICMILALVVMPTAGQAGLQEDFVKNQELQMKQHFYSDQLALLDFLGIDDFSFFCDEDIVHKKLPGSVEARCGIKLFIRQVWIYYQIRHVFTLEERDFLEMEFASTLACSRYMSRQWDDFKRDCPKDFQDFFDRLILEYK